MINREGFIGPIIFLSDTLSVVFQETILLLTHRLRFLITINHFGLPDKRQS